MVAAWMRAEIGVGPSIASGSQTCKGNWADLAIGPMNIKQASNVRVATGNTGWSAEADKRAQLMACQISTLLASVNVRMPCPRCCVQKPCVQYKSIKMPIRKPQSPMRLTTNAFKQAYAALDLYHQKPIKR